MCILMYFGPSAMPIREHLVNGCENNPDGFGYAVVTYDRGILIGHSMDAETAIDEFMAIRAEYPANTAIFHARIATHGTVDEFNCHPFYVNGRSDMVLAHNGVLPHCQPEKGDNRSDTHILADDIMMQRFGQLDDPKTRLAFEAWVGASKVIVLTTDLSLEYQSYIFNQSMGTWLNDTPEGQDIWYSNSSYCKRPRYVWKEYSASDFGYSTGYTIGYPPKSSTASKDAYTESWDSEKGRSWAGYIQACAECGYDMDDCGCQEPTWRYMPSWQVKSRPDETDYSDPMSWFCTGCKNRGGIDGESGKCQICDTMFCCDENENTCQCTWRRVSAIAAELESELLAIEGPKGDDTPSDVS